MLSKLTSRFLAAALVATVVFALPAHSQRRRAVSSPPAGNKVTADQFSGTVVDEVTGLPVVGARVQAGNRSDQTDESGKFLIKNVVGFHGVIVVETSRSGYQTVRQTTAGGNQVLTIRVHSTGTAHVRKTDNSTVDLDFDSILFGYPVVFSGYNSSTYDDFCKADGTRLTVDRSELKRLIGPAVTVAQTACCADRQVLKIRAELKNGTNTDLFFADSCIGIPSIELIGFNHLTHKKTFIPFSSVAEVVFP